MINKLKSIVKKILNKIIKIISGRRSLIAQMVISNERIVTKNLRTSRGCYLQFGAGLPSIKAFYDGVKQFDKNLNYNMYIFDTFTGPPMNYDVNHKLGTNIKNDIDFSKLWHYGGTDKFKKDLANLKVDLNFVTLVPGVVQETTKNFIIPNNEDIGIVNIDLGSKCYDSVSSVLEFLKPHLKNYTLFFFDDIHSHAGNPHVGALGALNHFNNKYKNECGIVKCPVFSGKKVNPEKILIDEVYWSWVK
tara:strand:- start:828 stop:1568 length:741 start_codon:yes stop_codon:yes gene_type:complete